MNPCKCSWLKTVTCVVAKPGNAFLTLSALSALGQIVISTSCPLNQRHKAAYVQATLMYGACNESDWAIRLPHSCICHWGPCSLVFLCFSFVCLVSVFVFVLSLLPPIPSSLYHCFQIMLLFVLSLSLLLSLFQSSSCQALLAYWFEHIVWPW